MLPSACMLFGLLEKLHSPTSTVWSLAGSKGAALIPIFPEVTKNKRRMQDGLRSCAAQDSILQEVIGPRAYPEDFIRFPIGWSRMPRFGVPGALLMGDAAHLSRLR